MGEEEEAMKKVTCLLAMVAAAAIALPAMGQSPDNVVGGSPPNQAQIPLQALWHLLDLRKRQPAPPDPKSDESIALASS